MKDCRTCVDVMPCEACEMAPVVLAEQFEGASPCAGCEANPGGPCDGCTREALMVVATPRRLDEGTEIPLPLMVPMTSGPSLLGLVGPLADVPFRLVVQTIQRAAARQVELFPKVRR